MSDSMNDAILIGEFMEVLTLSSLFKGRYISAGALFFDRYVWNKWQLYKQGRATIDSVLAAAFSKTDLRYKLVLKRIKDEGVTKNVS